MRAQRGSPPRLWRCVPVLCLALVTGLDARPAAVSSSVDAYSSSRLQRTRGGHSYLERNAPFSIRFEYPAARVDRNMLLAAPVAPEPLETPTEATPAAAESSAGDDLERYAGADAPTALPEDSAEQTEDEKVEELLMLFERRIGPDAATLPFQLPGQAPSNPSDVTTRIRSRYRIEP